MNIYEHFACHERLPVKLSDVKDHILETGLVSRMIRFPVDFENYIIHGGYHLYRDISPYAAPGQKVARIAYPRALPQGTQRLIQVKEMLHVLDQHEATAPTRALVSSLIDDLLTESSAALIGLPALVDRKVLLHAMCILMPLGVLDHVRPMFKNGDVTIEQIANEAMLPVGIIKVALTDEWRDLAFTIA